MAFTSKLGVWIGHKKKQLCFNRIIGNYFHNCPHIRMNGFIQTLWRTAVFEAHLKVFVINQKERRCAGGVSTHQQREPSSSSVWTLRAHWCNRRVDAGRSGCSHPFLMSCSNTFSDHLLLFCSTVFMCILGCWKMCCETCNLVLSFSSYLLNPAKKTFWFLFLQPNVDGSALIRSKWITWLHILTAQNDK